MNKKFFYLNHKKILVLCFVICAILTGAGIIWSLRVRAGYIGHADLSADAMSEYAVNNYYFSWDDEKDVYADMQRQGASALYKELFEQSELIIKCQFAGDRFVKDGMPFSYVTIEEVIKGDLISGDMITICEPAVIWTTYNDSDGTIYLYGTANLLQSDEEYIAFLKRTETPPGYDSDEQGDMGYSYTNMYLSAFRITDNPVSVSCTTEDEILYSDAFFADYIGLSADVEICTGLHKEILNIAAADFDLSV